MSNKRIVVIGAAAAAAVVIKSLERDFTHLTAILTSADDGGSGGMARRQYNMQAPGDARQALLALSRSRNRTLLDLFSHRFPDGPYKGHVFGTLLLAELAKELGGFEHAIAAAKKLLDVRADIIPATVGATTLAARLENGRIIRGETNIDIPKHDPNLKIDRAWLSRSQPLNPRAAAALKRADAVIIGPGDLYTSLIPVLLVPGLPKAIKASGAKVIYIVNLMTKHGETTNFAASDFITTIESYIGKHVIDIALINTRQPSRSQKKQYAKERSFPVAVDWQTLPIGVAMAFSDLMQTSGFAHHDPVKLRRSLLKLLR